MIYDQFGQVYTNSNELCDLLYTNPTIDIKQFQLQDPTEFNNSVHDLHAELPILSNYIESMQSIDEFDIEKQKQWNMPAEYHTLDIAAWILDQCKEDYQLQRVGMELLLYQERDLFNLLRYLKYLVDTLRKNNLVWGVGRGSSVASYVLYLLGVHKIDSIFYDLDIREFLK
jgi:DNA polymerase III alpha subunit